MPTSVIAAVPPGWIRASAVWTCVCVPSTAVTRPSSQCASATFSLVASAWTSTTIASACARASSTSPSITSNMSVDGERKSEPMTLITATFDPSAASATASPRAGRRGGEVRGPDDPLGAGEVRVDLLPPPGVVAERDHVRARGEEALGELRRDPDAVGDVLAVQDAERRRRGPRAGRAGAPRRRCGRPSRPRLRRRGSSARYRIDSVAAGCTSSDTLFPASWVWRARRLVLDPREVEQNADLGAARRDAGADRERRIGAQVRQRDDDGGCLVRAGCRSGRPGRGSRRRSRRSRRRRRPPGRRRPCPAAAPTSSAEVPGPVAAAQLEPDEPVLARAGDAVPEPREQTGVALPADRVEREGAGAGPVVADRGHGALGDRQLQAEGADGGDDLRLRRAAGQRARRGERPGGRRGRPEGGHEQGQQQHRRNEDGEDDASGATVRGAGRATPARAETSRVAVSGRSHGRHHSRPFRNLPPGRVVRCERDRVAVGARERGRPERSRTAPYGRPRTARGRKRCLCSWNTSFVLRSGFSLNHAGAAPSPQRMCSWIQGSGPPRCRNLVT